jgi:hypothetical protein
MSELGELLEPALPELLPCDHADPAYIANAPLNTRLDNTTALLFIYSPFAKILFTPRFICLLTDMRGAMLMPWLPVIFFTGASQVQYNSLSAVEKLRRK